MIFPQIQKVTDNLESALRGVKSPEYQTELAVRVATFESDAFDESPAQAVLRIDSFTKDLDDTPLSHSDQLQDYRIALLVRTSDASQVPLHTRMLVAAADVEAAVMADVTRGGNAITTDLIGGDPIDYQDEGFYGVDLLFRVRIRTLIDEPYLLTES